MRRDLAQNRPLMTDVYLQDTCRVAAPESRYGLEVQQTSVCSRSSLVLKPFTVFAQRYAIVVVHGTVGLDFNGLT